MERFKHKLIRWFLPFLFFFALSLFLHLLSTGFRLNVMINGGDTDYFINPWVDFFRGISIWNNESLGLPDSFALSKTITVIPAILMSLVIRDPNVVNLLYFSLIFSLSGTFMYILLSYLRMNWKASLIGSLFFMLNTFVYLRYHLPTPHLQIGYAFFPLLLYVFVRTFDGSLKFFKGVGIYAFLMLVIARTANIYFLYWVFIPLTGILLNYAGFVDIKLTIKKVFQFYLIGLLLNFVVFVTYFASLFNYSNAQNNYLLEFYRQGTNEIAKKYNLIEILGGIGSAAWVHNLYNEIPGYQAFSVLSSVGKFLITVFAVVPIVYIFSKNLTKRGFPIIIMLIGMAILATGFGAPFGKIYAAIFENLPVYRDFFRDTWTYWLTPYFGIVGILCGIAFDKSRLFGDKETTLGTFSYAVEIPVLLAMLLSWILLFIYPGKLVDQAWLVSVPDEYYEMADVIKDNYKDEHILALPLTDHVWGSTFYQWGYAGPDVMRQLTDFPYVDKYFNIVVSPDYVQMLEYLRTPDKDTLSDFLDKTKMSYILLRKDVLDTASSVKWSSILADGHCFNKITTSGALSLYEYTCQSDPVDSEAVFISNAYHNGNTLCNDEVYVEGIGLENYCRNLEPEGGAILIEDGSLSYKITSTLRDVNVVVDQDDNIPGLISLNGKDIDNYIEGDKEITLFEVNTVEIDTDKYNSDLFINDHFGYGGWDPNNIGTCDPNDLTDTGVDGWVDAQGILNLNTDKSQVCISNKLDKAANNSPAVLTIRYTVKPSSDQKIKYCVYDSEKDDCYYTGEIDQRMDPGLVTYYEEFGDENLAQVYFEDVSRMEDSDLELFLYFNHEHEDIYNIEISSIGFVQLPEEVSRVLIRRENGVSESTGHVLEGNRLSGKNVKLLDISEVRSEKVLISDMQNYNPQWILIATEKNNLLKGRVIDERVKVNGYSNGWILNNEGNDRLILVYYPQIIFIIGLLLTIWGYIWWGYFFNKKNV